MHRSTATPENTGTNSGQRGSRWRVAAWVAAGLVLLLPLVAGADWTGSDFVFAAVLLFGALGAYEFVARTTGNTAYRAGAGLAIAALLLLLWSNGAVGITDSSADMMFLLLVPAVAIIGALTAHFKAPGMARAMVATALTQASIAVIALLAGMVPAYNSAFEILGISGFFAGLFVGSALLFQKAAREESERGAA